jgi:AcrR family transcriptional regulator
VFVEHGLSAAKVEDITARAGVSKGAFYLHFGSKEDCFRQIVEGFLAKLASCLDEGPPNAEVRGTEDWAQHLASWLRHDVAIFDFCWQNRGLMNILLTGGGGGPFGYLMDEFAERVAEQIQVWARHLVAVGVYRNDVDPELFPALIAGGYERMIRAMIKRTTRPDIERWSRQALDVYMRGVLTDAARAVVDREVSRPGGPPVSASSGDGGLVKPGEPPPSSASVGFAIGAPLPNAGGGLVTMGPPPPKPATRLVKMMQAAGAPVAGARARNG